MVKEKFLGCMYGLAVGDTIGFQVEFIPLETIKDRYGESGVTDIYSGKTLFSDDTQMSLATASALIQSWEKSEKYDIEQIMEQIGINYINWLNSSENTRAPGFTCINGVRNLEKRMTWRESGIKESKGCGAAMRTAPIGLFFNKIDQLVEVAYGASICTHAHDTGIASGIATALLTHLALKGTPPEDMINQTIGLLESAGKKYNFSVSDMNKMLYKVEKKQSRVPEKAIPYFGQGWVGDEAVGIALYSFLKSPSNYKQTVLTAVNLTGDSDSTGCIAGAISGAYNGVQAIPHEWIAKLEKRKEIEKISKELYISARK